MDSQPQEPSDMDTNSIPSSACNLCGRVVQSASDDLEVFSLCVDCKFLLLEDFGTPAPAPPLARRQTPRRRGRRRRRRTSRPDSSESVGDLSTQQFTHLISMARQSLSTVHASEDQRDDHHFQIQRKSSLSDSEKIITFTAYATDPKGLWGVIAQKAKSVIEDDDKSNTNYSSDHSSTTASQSRFSYLSDEGFKKMDNPKLRRGLDKLTSSLNQIGDTFEKAFEEGRTLVENKTADIIQETRKLQTRRRGTGGGEDESQNQSYGVSSSWKKSPEQPVQLNHMEHETQLKASRDVAMATAAKAKLLLRELKTVRADLTFAKERCAQLEEENKHMRENHREKGSNPADEDLIRLQLESLLAEKARLAHENSVYARENRFLREIVEYHQLTMQDVVYIDEGSEEVTQVYPFVSTLMTSSPAERTQSPSQEMIKEIIVVAEESSVCASVVSAS